MSVYNNKLLNEWFFFATTMFYTIELQLYHVPLSDKIKIKINFSK